MDLGPADLERAEYLRDREPISLDELGAGDVVRIWDEDRRAYWDYPVAGRRVLYRV